MKRTPFLSLVLLALGALPVAAQDTPWSEEEAAELQTAQQALQDGNFSLALRAFDALLAAHAENGSLHRLKGHALVGLQRDPEARAEFLEALQRGELSADVFSRLMEIDYRAGQSVAMLASTQLPSLR